MATTYTEVIPQQGTPQTFGITLGGNPYQLTIRWRTIFAAGQSGGLSDALTADNTLITADTTLVSADETVLTADAESALLSGLTFTIGDSVDQWVLDISDQSGTPILQGIPLVTGADLLAQYGYYNFGGGLWVSTTNNPDAVPTFDNLGGAAGDAQLYWVVETT